MIRRLAAALLAALLMGLAAYAQSDTTVWTSIGGAAGGGGGAGVSSFNSRTGAVLPQAGDYSCALLSDAVASCNTLAWTNTRLAKTANYAGASADCGKTIALGGSTFFTLTLTAASGYTSNCVFFVVNEDTGRGKQLSVNGVSAFVLWPLQTAIIFNDNNVWQVNRPNRWKIPSTVTLNVASGGTTFPNTDCLGTGASACSTIAGAANIACTQIDAGILGVIIQLASPGTYTEQVNLCQIQSAAQGASPGANGSVIQGDLVTPTNVVIDGGAGAAIRIGGRSNEWILQGVSLQGFICLAADGGAWIRLGRIRFNTCSSTAAQATAKGTVEFQGNVDINTGAAAAFTLTQNQGMVLNAGGNTFTLIGSPTFSVGFANGDDASLQSWDNAVFSGAVGAGSSPRYSINGGAGIHTGTSGSATFLPGNAPGTGAGTNGAWYW